MLGVQPIVIGLLLEALYALYASEGSLLKALGLFSLIKNSPSLSPVVERLLEACSDKKLDQVHSMELQNSIRTKIEKFASDIEKIGQGKLEFDSTSWLSVDTKFLSEVKTELLATSHADATTVWGSQVGKKYWELNKEKIREGMIPS